MNTLITQDAALQAWKRQLDASLRMIEALTEGAERLHATQLEAAAAAHADAVATQGAAAQAKDAAALTQLQIQWLRGNAEKSVAYWRAVYENAMQTSREIAACLPTPGGDEAAK